VICPFCSQEIQEHWQPFHASTDWQGVPLQEPDLAVRTVTKPAKRKFEHIEIEAYWAVCRKCSELMVKIRKAVTHMHSTRASAENLARQPTDEREWLALPQRKLTPPISNLVPDTMARDYREAFLILDDSPRMSSVLSRRILGDLLEEYAKINRYTLAKQIDAFVNNTDHPIRHRENLHYLREIGDFSAHTKKDAQGEVIEVSREEAEWTLQVISGLFDYLIVAPETDKAIRSRIDEKLKAAGRKPIANV
jgi:Domain of unknown function (DUF4145)